LCQPDRRFSNSPEKKNILNRVKIAIFLLLIPLVSKELLGIRKSFFPLRQKRMALASNMPRYSLVIDDTTRWFQAGMSLYSRQFLFEGDVPLRFAL
jgi:hypothetical protein